MCFHVILASDRPAEAAVCLAVCQDTAALSAFQSHPASSSLQLRCSRCPSSSAGCSVSDTPVQHPTTVTDQRKPCWWFSEDCQVDINFLFFFFILRYILLIIIIYTLLYIMQYKRHGLYVNPQHRVYNEMLVVVPLCDPKSKWYIQE